MVSSKDLPLFFCMQIFIFPVLAFLVFEKAILGLYIFGPYWWCKFKSYTHFKAGLDSQIIREDWVCTLRQLPSCLSNSVIFIFSLAALGKFRFIQNFSRSPYRFSHDPLWLLKSKVLVFTEIRKCSYTNCGFRTNLLLCLIFFKSLFIFRP